ncbi:MAG TPA: hypothetical protein VJC04_00375 [Candidatus Paceibacterota bacterium]
MPETQGFSAVILVIILAVLAGGGYYVWKNNATTPASNSVDTNNGPPPPINLFTTIDTSDLPTDQSGWKTYRNKEYGFELKYPGSLIIRYTNVEKAAVFGFDNPSSDQSLDPSPDGLVGIAIFKTPEAFENSSWRNTGNVGEDVIIDGQKAKKMIVTISLGQAPHKIYYSIPERKTSLMFNRSSNEISDSDMNKILSTFRFID